LKVNDPHPLALEEPGLLIKGESREKRVTPVFTLGRLHEKKEAKR